MTPTNDVAPYITGAAPRRISIRSTSVRSSVGRSGLNAPPHGTPSTTSRNASNSLRPHISGAADAGPWSPPGAMSTPATVESAEARSVAFRARRSSPSMTVTCAGTVMTSSAIFVAVTSMVSFCFGTSVCANAAAAKSSAHTAAPSVRVIFVVSFNAPVAGKTGALRRSDVQARGEKEGVARDRAECRWRSAEAFNAGDYKRGRSRRAGVRRRRDVGRFFGDTRDALDRTAVAMPHLAIGVAPFDDVVVVEPRRLAALLGGGAAEVVEPREIGVDGERARDHDDPLVQLVAVPEEDSRVARCHVRHAEAVRTDARIEVRRDAHRVVRAAVDRKKRLPLLGAGRHGADGDHGIVPAVQHRVEAQLLPEQRRCHEGGE